MTDYVKSTSFARDSLAVGNPLKIVKGTEIDTEFNNIAIAVATKADANNSVLTGTPTAPTADTGNSSNQIATTSFVTAQIGNDAPTKTGTGASGTWGISILGNAATATTAANGGVTSVNGMTGSVTIAAPSTSTILAALAGTSLGAIGSYAFLSCVDNVIIPAGTTKAGSSLRYRSAQTAGGRFGSGSYVDTPSAGGVAGTWMLMGYIEGYYEYYGINSNHSNCVSLWLRVS